jgi:hypothetical protein
MVFSGEDARKSPISVLTQRLEIPDAFPIRDASVKVLEKLDRLKNK